MLRAVRHAAPNAPPVVAHLRTHAAAGGSGAWAEVKLSTDVRA
jgi:hypothetical protein